VQPWHSRNCLSLSLTFWLHLAAVLYIFTIFDVDSASHFPCKAWTHRHTQSQTQLITVSHVLATVGVGLRVILDFGLGLGLDRYTLGFIHGHTGLCWPLCTFINHIYLLNNIICHCHCCNPVFAVTDQDCFITLPKSVSVSVYHWLIVLLAWCSDVCNVLIHRVAVDLRSVVTLLWRLRGRQSKGCDWIERRPCCRPNEECAWSNKESRW